MTVRRPSDTPTTAPAPARRAAGSAGSLPRTPHRLSMRRNDLAIVEAAATSISDLGAELDRRLTREKRDSEILRMTRETTNQITRIANDAIHAYVRASRAVRAEMDRPGADVDAAQAMREKLDAARAAILDVLRLAEARYVPKVGELGTDEAPVPDA
jgi:hypothetical protein